MYSSPNSQTVTCPTEFIARPDLLNGRGLGWAMPLSSIVRLRKVYLPVGKAGSNTAQGAGQTNEPSGWVGRLPD